MKFVSMQLKSRADEIAFYFSDNENKRIRIRRKIRKDKNAVFSAFFFSSLSVSSSAFAIDILLQSSSAFSTKTFFFLEEFLVAL